MRRMEMARAEVGVDPVTAALVGWLVNRVATAGQRVLARWLGGDKQAKALRPVVSKAIQAAVEEIDVPGDREAVVGVLRREGPGIPEIDISDVLALREAVLRLISPRLAVLAEQGYQVDADRLADAITQRMESGIQFDAARGGPLAPVAELLPQHPDTLSAGASLALFTRDAGDPAVARDQLAALLPVRDRVSGTKHPATLAIRALFALFTGEAGDAAGAGDQLASLLPVIERVVGARHPDTVAVRANLVYWTEQAGKSLTARKDTKFG